MICEKCGAENPEGAKFCNNCGNELNETTEKTEQSRREPKILGYHYVKYVSIKENHYSFVTPDGKWIGVPINKVADFNCQPGDYTWIYERKTQDGKHSYYRVDEGKGAPWAQIQTLLWQYKKEDVVAGPIIEKNDNFAKIQISPSIFGIVNKSDADDIADFKNLDKDTLYHYEFINISVEDGKFRATLKPVKRHEDSYKYRNAKKFAETIEKICVYENVVDKLKQNTQDYDAVNATLKNDVTPGKLEKYISKKLKEQISDHTLCIGSGKFDIVFVDLEMKNSDGVPLAAKLVKQEKRENTYRVASVCAFPASFEMERFVYVEDWEKTLSDLAELSAPEEWDFDDDQNNRKSILENYLKYTFYKAKLDGRIVDNGTDAIFNTGLVDAKYNDIYCHLKSNSNINDAFERKWEIKTFATQESSAGKSINKIFARFPQPPAYIDPEHLEMIFFDTSKELFCDYEHIIEDNIGRLPREMIRHAIREDEILSKIKDKGELPDDVKQAITHNPEIVRKLENDLKSSVETAKKYCRWNYKTAIPVYYARNNSISLLLPLSGLVREGQIDVALVIERLPNGNYQGQTILDLHMAYQDARQICRPNSEWLKRK